MSRYAERCEDNPEKRAKYLVGKRIVVPNARWDYFYALFFFWSRLNMSFKRNFLTEPV